jgi:sterol 3beta-glucosyltransferase
MRITILALGSPEDVQPVVALALGLERAGHMVRIGAPPHSAELIISRGLRYSPLGRPLERAPNAPPNRWTLMTTVSSIGLYARSLFRKKGAPTWPVKMPFLELMVDDCLAACQDAEALVLCRHHLWFLHIAKARDIPCIQWDIYPFTATRQFPCLFVLNVFRGLPRLGHMLAKSPRINAWTQRAFERIVFDLSVRFINSLREDRPQIPPVTDTIPFADELHRPATVLYGFSPVVVAPRDWPATHHVTGYWYLDAPHAWHPPADLLRFLDAGDPPICFSFASKGRKVTALTLPVLLGALARTRYRAILLRSKDSAAFDGTLPENVFVTDEIPHEWLFRQVAAVVHQADTTTTSEVLRAGVPSVVVLVGRGKLFWADRLHKLGVCPAPIPKRRLSPSKLAATIHATVVDPQFRKRAQAVAREIEKEDGVGRAVEVFESCVSHHKDTKAQRM